MARLAIHPHEWEVLLWLDDWACRLFMALIACSDFRSGTGHATYGELIGLLTPHQPERGPRMHVRTRDEVKNMLLRFEAVGLMERHTVLSGVGQRLIFNVASRTGKAASFYLATRELTRESTWVRNGKNPATARPAAMQCAQTDPGIDPRTRPYKDHEEIQKNARARPPVDKSAAPVSVRAALEQIKRDINARRGGKK